MQKKTFVLLSAFIGLALWGCKKDTDKPFPPAPIANAGPSQIVTLPLDSVWLSGVATDASSKIDAYLWSEVSGPNVPVIASEGSKTTLVSGLTVGTYIFQFMAIDSLGLTGVDTLSITVKPTVKDTLYLGDSFETTFLCNTSNYPNGNPASIELMAATWTISGIEVFGRSLFRFDIPANGNIPVKSALLTLYSDTIPINGDLVHANSGSNNDFYIQRITSNWDPATAVWLNQPSGETAGQVYLPQTSQPFLNLVNLDVTTMVNNMITSGNYGFIMRLNTEVLYNSRIFCSGNYSDQSRRPRLILNY